MAAFPPKSSKQHSLYPLPEKFGPVQYKFHSCFMSHKLLVLCGVLRPQYPYCVSRISGWYTHPHLPLHLAVLLLMEENSANHFEIYEAPDCPPPKKWASPCELVLARFLNHQQSLEITWIYLREKKWMLGEYLCRFLFGLLLFSSGGVPPQAIVANLKVYRDSTARLNVTLVYW